MKCSVTQTHFDQTSQLSRFGRENHAFFGLDNNNSLRFNSIQQNRQKKAVGRQSRVAKIHKARS